MTTKLKPLRGAILIGCAGVFLIVAFLMWGLASRHFGGDQPWRAPIPIGLLVVSILMHIQIKGFRSDPVKCWVRGAWRSLRSCRADIRRHLNHRAAAWISETRRVFCYRIGKRRVTRGGAARHLLASGLRILRTFLLMRTCGVEEHNRYLTTKRRLPNEPLHRPRGAAASSFTGRISACADERQIVRRH
jgi:hypothetical protein